MNDNQKKDSLHYAMIQHLIQNYGEEQQDRTYRLAGQIQAVLDTEPDQELAQAALALVSAERLIRRGVIQ